jgi:hypothetical protein
MLFGRELGLPRMYSLNKLYVVDQKVSCQGETMLALIKRSGQYGYRFVKANEEECVFELWPYAHPDQVYTASATIKFAREHKWDQQEWWDKGGGGMRSKPKATWQKFPGHMLRWRCVSEAARIVCPEIIAGMYTPEELGAPVEVDDTTGEVQVARVVETTEETAEGTEGATPVAAAGADQVPAAPAVEEAPKRRVRPKKAFKAEDSQPEAPVPPHPVIEGEYTEEPAETDGAATRLQLVPEDDDESELDTEDDETQIAGFDEDGNPITPEGEAAAAEAEAQQEDDEETGEVELAWAPEDDARIKTVGDLRNYLMTKDLATPKQQSDWKASLCEGAFAGSKWNELSLEDRKVLYLIARDGEE